jgi:uncharacterized protein YkwD
MRSLALITLTWLAAPVAAATPDLEQVERLVARRTHEFRAESRLGRLEPDGALDRAAQAFAEYMARTDRYGHAADGSQPSARARASGYDYCLVSENIAYQFSSAGFGTEELARRLVEGWKASPGHRRNMLEPHAVHMGSGVARSARTNRYYAVQMFGRPRARSIEFHVTNVAGIAVRYRVDEEAFTLRSRQQRIHTTCTPPVVTFDQATNAEGRIFRPSNGEKLRVEGDKRLVVRSER